MHLYSTIITMPYHSCNHYKLWPVATDALDGQSVGLLATTVRPANMAEVNEMLFEVVTRECPGNHVLDQGLGSHWMENFWEGGGSQSTGTHCATAVQKWQNAYIRVIHQQKTLSVSLHHETD